MEVVVLIANAFLLTAICWTDSVPALISEGRITKGTVVTGSELSFMACLVGYNSVMGYRTGAGTIITDLYILSSAHFTYKYYFIC